MRRDTLLDRLRSESDPWDIIVIGGGATGLGAAVDSAARGYRTLLLEQHDFAKGTSSRSTKLIHGGVRYLRQGNVALVLEALRERRLLLQNAPHLVSGLSFVVPAYAWWSKPLYGLGLKLYDLLAGRDNLAASRRLSREETLVHLPTVRPAGLRGGTLYYDAVFDDARLAITLAQTVGDLGGLAINYARVRGLLKQGGLVSGVIATDEETGEGFELRARTVINATGVFEQTVRQMDDPAASSVTSCSQGVHIVLDREFLPGASALMVPSTDDGRVFFAIPWLGRIILGTTDTPVQSRQMEPLPLAKEVQFILSHAGRYLERKPEPSDALSVFAGLRPLIRPSVNRPPSAISRDHRVSVSGSGLVTIIGGKWTTYRRMGEAVVDRAAIVGGLEKRPCQTRTLRLRGWVEPGSGQVHPGVCPTDDSSTGDPAKEGSGPDRLLHPELPYRAHAVIRAVREEMARSVEDVLARRTRSLLLNARASIEAAPVVARLMAREMGRDEQWLRDQVSAYRDLACRYVL